MHTHHTHTLLSPHIDTSDCTAFNRTLLDTTCPEGITNVWTLGTCTGLRFKEELQITQKTFSHTNNLTYSHVYMWTHIWKLPLAATDKHSNTQHCDALFTVLWGGPCKAGCFCLVHMTKVSVLMTLHDHQTFLSTHKAQHLSLKQTHTRAKQHSALSVIQHLQKKPSQPTIPVNRTVMDSSGIGF